MIKDLLKYAVYGISIGCIYLVICLLLLDLFWPTGLYGVMQNFTLQILGGLTVSAVSSGGAVVYKFERLHFGLQIAIHLIIVFAVGLPIAFGLGWFPSGAPVVIVIIILVWLLVFFVTWLGFYLHGNREVKKINDKIKERDSKK